MRLLLSALVMVCLPLAAGAQTPFTGTPVNIPGVVEAERFDLGGQGVAYNDTDAVNDGGTVFRPNEGVDIFNSPGSPGDPVVKNFATSEWMIYTINVTETAWYDFKVKVASPFITGKLHIEIDGVNVTGTVQVPNTGGNEVYQWIVAKLRVPLTAGVHRMKIVSDEQWFGVDAFNISTSPVGTSFFATPVSLPGIIQAENFNNGGPGVAYGDTDAINDGNEYRTGEGVDIFTSSGAPEPGNYVVKNFATGEWMLYTVDVSAAGQYDFKVRVATKLDTAKFHIEIDGVNVTGTVVAPSTSTVTWEAYQWMVASTRVPLAAGTHHLAIVSDEQWVGIDAIEVASSPLFTGTPHGGTPAAVPGTIEAENFDDGGEGVAYHDTDAVNEGTQYRTGEGVDLFTSSGAPEPGNYVVKNFANGEWMAYTINVQTTGEYDFKVRLATKLSDSTFHIEIDGNNVTGTVAVPSTSTTTWEAYQWHTAKTNVLLSSGTHVLKIVSDQQWVGLDKFEITSSQSSPPALFTCSFQSGWTQCGFTEEANGSGRAMLVNLSRDGDGKAARLHTEPGTGDFDRNDLRLKESADFCQEGQEEWWAHSVWFPDDYVVPPSGHWGVVMDFHHVHPTLRTHQQANFHIDAMPNPIGLRIRGYGGQNLDDGKWMRPIGPVVKTRWYDFVYHVKWSSRSDGFFDVWVNGDKIPNTDNPSSPRTHQGPTLYAGYTCTFKLANYHSPFGQASSVVHDRVRRGNSAAAVVVPGQTLE